jgi:glycosyltransferase involved in cell wall biosynthesis
VPDVSVIIPTHNRASSLATAIASALGQYAQDVEIVVVDDASTDNTADVVAQYADSRIKYVRQPVTRGVAAARNEGIRRSSGRFIAFLDDDDEWMPDKLALQLPEFYRDDNVGLVYSGRITILTATGESSVLNLIGDLETQLRLFWITTSTVVVSREGIQRVGLFDEEMPCASDYDMWIRFWRAGYRTAAVNRPLAKYTVQANALSGDPVKLIAGRTILLTKHEAFFAEDRRSQGAHYRRLGLLCWRAGRASKAREAFARSFRSHRSIRPLVYTLLCSGGPGLYRILDKFRQSVWGDHEA